MELKSVFVVSMLLAFTAGFADATTFVSASSLFSSHLTGNFVVLAYDIMIGATADAWLKMIAFPVFICAVILAEKIAEKRKNIYLLVFLEGLMLLASAGVIWVLKEINNPIQWLPDVVAMVIVSALAFQNAFGRIYTKAQYGATTVMTTNVTTAVVSLSQFLFVKYLDPEKAKTLRNQFMMIASFLLGCLLGAYCAKKIGLCAVAIPGFMLVIYFAKKNIFQKN